jgi:hypothetical protein
MLISLLRVEINIWISKTQKLLRLLLHKCSNKFLTALHNLKLASPSNAQSESNKLRSEQSYAQSYAKRSTFTGET